MANGKHAQNPLDLTAKQVRQSEERMIVSLKKLHVSEEKAIESAGDWKQSFLKTQAHFKGFKFA